MHVWRRECAWERKSRKRRLPGGENELAWRSPALTMRNARLGRGRSKLAAESERPDGREKVWIEVMKALGIGVRGANAAGAVAGCDAGPRAACSAAAVRPKPHHRARRL